MSIDDADSFTSEQDDHKVCFDEGLMLPYIPDLSTPNNNTGSNSTANTSPYLLISNDALRHFWGQYFADKEYVRWTSFLSKLEDHLASPKPDPTEQAPDPATAPAPTTSSVHSTLAWRQEKFQFPVSPNGYGLHPNELLVLFRERDGKRNLSKALKYALDLEGTGVLSVYQVALVVRNILPASAPLKHLIFHLAHLGGKILLPPAMYNTSAAVEFLQQLQVAYNKAVNAEKQFSMYLQKEMKARFRNSRRAEEEDSDNGASGVDTNAANVATAASVQAAGLYSPFERVYSELQGTATVQQSIETFVNKTRGE